MIEVLLDLGFDCCLCGGCVGVTLKCSGSGLAEAGHKAAAVKVPYPHCCGVNEVIFEPNGLILDVRSCRSARGILEPSLN
jgi:hypothetical protein